LPRDRTLLVASFGARDVGRSSRDSTTIGRTAFSPKWWHAGKRTCSLNAARSTRVWTSARSMRA
jgi:hypothetical protein